MPTGTSPTWRLLVLSATLVAATSGCSPETEDQEVGRPSSAQCADSLSVKGEPWTAWPLADPLERDLVGKPRTATRTGCDDVAGDPPETPVDSTVTLRRIAGLSADSALFRPDKGYQDVIYVPGDPSLTFEELPRKVRRLIERG